MNVGFGGRHINLENGCEMFVVFVLLFVLMVIYMSLNDHVKNGLEASFGLSHGNVSNDENFDPRRILVGGGSIIGDRVVIQAKRGIFKVFRKEKDFGIILISWLILVMVSVCIVS